MVQPGLPPGRRNSQNAGGRLRDWLTAACLLAAASTSAVLARAQAPMTAPPEPETAPLPKPLSIPDVAPIGGAPQPPIVLPRPPMNAVNDPAPAAPPPAAKPPGFGPRLSDLIGGVHPRLEGMPAGIKPPLGMTPVPDADVRRKFDQFVGGFQDPENTIELIVGRPRIWTLKKRPFRIQTGDETEKTLSYAPLDPKDPRQLSLIGKAVGSTVLNLWFGDPDDPERQTVLSYLVQILPDPEAKERLERVYKALEDEINRAFPDAYVCLFLVGDKLVVTGQVKDVVEATTILQILRANAPTSGPHGASNIPLNQATLNLGAAGLTPDGQLRPALENYLIQGETNIVNLLRVPGEQQVMLKVVVAEINRSAARSIGLNELFTNKAGVQVFSQTTGPVNPNLTALLDASRIGLSIEALRSVNLARSLAEPNLVAINGLPASFQAGGEFPVPVVTGATATGLQGVSFVPFGVQLNFIPYISDKDKIRLQLSAVVSVRDTSLGTNFNSSSINNNNSTFVPGLTTRNVQTTVEMREGQTLAIAGLLQSNLGAQTTRVPGLGDLPFGGQLFRTDRTQSGESELVLLVTPELVHPLEPHEVPALPGSDYFEPGDLEFYLLGRQESLRAYDYRSQVMNTLGRMAAYRRCETLYFVGPHGHTEPK